MVPLYVRPSPLVWDTDSSCSRNVLFLVEWKFTCSRFHVWDYLLILDMDVHAYAHTAYVVSIILTNDVRMQL